MAASVAGRPSLLKPNVDAALASTPSVEHVIVVKRVDEPVDMRGRAATTGGTT